MKLTNEQGAPYLGAAYYAEDWPGDQQEEDLAPMKRGTGCKSSALPKAYHEIGFEGYMRPDHGRMIGGETGRPGYGLYDRALGIVLSERALGSNWKMN